MTSRPQTEVHLDVEPAPDRPAPRVVEDPSFHVALVGDFSGRASGGRRPPAPLETHRVDRDDLDEVLARLAPTARVQLGGGELEVGFRALDDFEPDALVDRLSVFRTIREVADSAGPDRRAPGREAPAPRPAPTEEILSGSVLDRIVDADEGAEAARDPLRAWVDELVRPHLERSPSPEDARMKDQVDRLVADGMRELLRDPAFRRLEALWRSVDLLVRRIDTGPRLTLHLVDAGPEVLAADPEAAPVAELLARGVGPEGEPWSVVALLQDLSPDPEHLVPLRALARRARPGGTVLLAGADPSLGGPLWEAFRREPEAASVGLAIPRPLLRLPWGEDTVPCARISFEEITGTPSARDYLWGPAVVPVTLVLARAFAAAGGELARAVDPEIAGMPLHVVDGEAIPPVEVSLTRAEADQVAESGLMPVVWMKGTDRLRLDRLHSVGGPGVGLAGWWRGGVG